MNTEEEEEEIDEIFDRADLIRRPESARYHP